MGITIDVAPSRAGYSADVVQWQVNILETAKANNIISAPYEFGPNRPATRADVFSMAVSIAISVTKNTPKAPIPEMSVSL